MWGGSRGNDAVQPFNSGGGGGTPSFSVGGAMQQQQGAAPAGGGAPRFQMGGQAPQQPQQGYGGYGQQTQPTQGGFQPQGGYGQQQPPAQQPPAQQPAQGAGRFMPSFPRSPQAQRNPQFQAGGREQAMPTFGAQAQQQQQQQQSFGRREGAQRGQMFQGQQQQETQPDPNGVPRDSDPREIPKPAERPPGAPPPVFRIGGDIGGSDPNDQSPRRFYNQGSLQGGGAQGTAQGDAGGGGGGVSSFFNRGMAAAAQRMAAPRPTAMAAGRRGPLLTSVSLQYYYYFGVCWDVTFVLFTFVVMLWKGIKLPYPKYDYQTRDYESVWSIEFAFLFVFIMFEWPRMSLLNKANRGTHHLTMYASILLGAPIVAYHLWAMFSATYVLHIDVFVNGVSLAFIGMQVMLGYLATTAWPRGTVAQGAAKRVIGGAGSASRRTAADPTVGAPKFNVGAGNN